MGSTTPRGGSLRGRYVLRAAGRGRRPRRCVWWFGPGVVHAGGGAAPLPPVAHELHRAREPDRDHEREDEALPRLLLEGLPAEIAEARCIRPPDEPREDVRPDEAPVREALDV